MAATEVSSTTARREVKMWFSPLVKIWLTNRDPCSKWNRLDRALESKKYNKIQYSPRS